MKRKRARGKRGTLSAEVVATLYVLLLGIFFPMLDMAVTGLRAFFLYFACCQAVTHAAVANTFQVPKAPANTAAITVGTAAYNAVIKAFGSFLSADSGPTFSILKVPIPNAGSGSTVTYTAPLSAANVDVSKYVYIIQCDIVGNVMPWIPLNLGHNVIPGLTGEIDLHVWSQQEFENPYGLEY